MIAKLKAALEAETEKRVKEYLKEDPAMGWLKTLARRDFRAGGKKDRERLLRAIEVLQDTIDSGYDQAGHCFSFIEELKSELGIE